MGKAHMSTVSLLNWSVWTEWEWPVVTGPNSLYGLNPHPIPIGMRGGGGLEMSWDDTLVVEENIE
jgi:hypothetical protein